MSAPYKKPESVLIVIYDEKGQVLVMQRKDDPSFWQSVTGSLEQNETPMQTAVRELHEETGINIDKYGYSIEDCHTTNQYPIRPDWQYRYAPDVSSNLEYVFKVQISQSTPIVLTEHLAYQWMDKNLAVEKVWSESNKTAIQDFVPAAL